MRCSIAKALYGPMIELVDGVIDLNLRDLQKVTALGEVLRSKRRDSGPAHLFAASIDPAL